MAERVDLWRFTIFSRTYYVKLWCLAQTTRGSFQETIHHSPETGPLLALIATVVRRADQVMGGGGGGGGWPVSENNRAADLL